MKGFRKEFIEAVKDYRLFLRKGYPQKTIHQVVSTRYSLSSEERSMLYRGISTEPAGITHKEDPDRAIGISGNDLHVDTWNTILTVYSYLAGITVYIADDGVLRDVAESHGPPGLDKHFNRAITLLSGFLNETTPSSVLFYLDEKMTLSRQLSKEITKPFIRKEVRVKSIVSGEVDQVLASLDSGVVASSDSQILKRSRVPVIDLPRMILQRFFNPRFSDLRTL